mmetsp:Transcript_37883/g.77096  ORF Transcript_37883/g.77096 Transcript_37883/m.77096 type:complete len:681 (+) Transcript_37883:445-2487(+)
MKAQSLLWLCLFLPAAVCDTRTGTTATSGNKRKIQQDVSGPASSLRRKEITRQRDVDDVAAATTAGTQNELHEEQAQQVQEQARPHSPRRNLQDDKPAPIGYIIGGTHVTDPERYKYIVSLTKWGGHFCGGAMIAPDLVISAAHCQNIDGAKVGIINKNDNTGPIFTGLDVNGITRSTTCDASTSSMNIHIHENYGDNYVNDVMIVKLGGSVDASAYPTVRINSDASAPSSGDPLTTMGWGQTIAGSSTSMANTLNEVEVHAISQSQCQSMYGGYLQDNMFCAMDAGRDACQGDSGGPLVKLGSGPDSDVLTGVVSWGYGCASATHAGVYSRLSYNYAWIRDKVCCLSSAPPAYMGCPGSSTPNPTPEPTPNPTPEPTPNPTPEPTPNPTPGPTASTPTAATPTPAPSTSAPVTEEPTDVPPTPAPVTSAPTFSPLPPPIPRSTITICLQNDMFPNDIAMWLENSSGTEVYAYVDNLSTDEYQYKLYSKTVHFTEDILNRTKEMRFVITDAYGDGLTMTQSQHEEGNYWLVLGDDCTTGEHLVQGRSGFGFVAEDYFLTDDTCEGNNCISIQMKFDQFPNDITYSVQCGNETLRDHAGSYSNADLKDETITEVVFIPETNTDDCNVTIHDQHGDGLCCAHGEGYASIYLGSVNGTFVASTTNSSFYDFPVTVQRSFSSTS